jgi:hypothetical protein
VPLSFWGNSLSIFAKYHIGSSLEDKVATNYALDRLCMNPGLHMVHGGQTGKEVPWLVGDPDVRVLFM